KATASAKIQFIERGPWQWNAGVEYSYRTFRNVTVVPERIGPFFTNGSASHLSSGVERSLVRFPERRFTLDATAAGGVGAFFVNPLGKYGRIEGSLSANW